MTRLMQRGTGVLAAGISYAAFLLLRFYPRPLIVPIVLVVWIALLYLLHQSMSKRARWKHDIMYISIATVLSMTGLIFVIEEPVVRFVIMLLVSVVLGLLYGWGAQYEHTVHYTAKPFRRFIMMLWVFNVYALTTFFFALKFFFPTGMFQLFWLHERAPFIANAIPQGFFFVFLVLIAGIFSTAVSIIIWRMYYQAGLQHFLVWGALVGLITMELMWVLHLLPFDYAVLGFLLTWIWYVVQLFVRFHFSRKGIDWKSQRAFLLVNFGLFLLFLIFFVRWV